MLGQPCTIKSPLPALSTCGWWLLSHTEGSLGTLLTPGAGRFLREVVERVRGWAVWEPSVLFQRGGCRRKAVHPDVCLCLTSSRLAQQQVSHGVYSQQV